MKKIESEKRIVNCMIRLYCRKKHGGTKELCSNCKKVEAYAFERLNKCQFGENKPACKECKIHCYSKNMRETIREIMRFSGPRMPLYYPFYSIYHLLKK